MQQRMSFEELVGFLTGLHGALTIGRINFWLTALHQGSNGFITRTVEGQTFTILYVDKDMYEVTFK